MSEGYLEVRLVFGEFAYNYCKSVVGYKAKQYGSNSMLYLWFVILSIILS